MTPYYLSVARWHARRAWLWLTSRIAVEVTRWRTRHYQGHHSEPYLDDQWPDVIHGDPVMPLPLARDDYLQPWIDAAWERTGTTHADYWRATAPAYEEDELDRRVAAFHASLPAVSAPATTLHGHGGELTPGQRQNLWQPHDVIPARVIAALENASAVDTVVPRSAPAVLTAYVERVTGGDPYDGLGSDDYIERLFAPIKARADESIARIRASLAVPA